MKIVICGSMVFAKKMKDVKDYLIKKNFEVYLTELIGQYIKINSIEKKEFEAASNKIKYDMIQKYFDEIGLADAILVVNEDKKGISNYIGGNTFLEMGFAYVLKKKIFLLNDIPKMNYADEIIAMKPIILNGNLNLIK
ncbi:MAG: hypothetical protein PHP82_03175 [Candidatus ainarchaeum sp.]|nr:hypothetical protein [Candidatus ainarchaeum sp.]